MVVTGPRVVVTPIVVTFNVTELGEDPETFVAAITNGYCVPGIKLFNMICETLFTTFTFFAETVIDENLLLVEVTV